MNENKFEEFFWERVTSNQKLVLELIKEKKKGYVADFCRVKNFKLSKNAFLTAVEFWTKWGFVRSEVHNTNRSIEMWVEIIEQ